MTTQIATDTELSAVNSILGSIGQSPVTTLGTVTTDTTNTGQEIANTFCQPTNCNDSWTSNGSYKRRAKRRLAF